MGQHVECPSCNQEVGATDRFCRHCGAKVKPEGESATRSHAVDDLALEYRNVLVETPDDPDALYNVGLAELYSGKPSVAEGYFRQVTALLPNDHAAHERLAVCLAKLGRKDEALEAARAAYRIDPERASIQRMLRALGG